MLNVMTSTIPADDARAEAVPLLEFRGVSKQYPGVLALDNVDFTLRSGEVHALFGENGAGKSTLISLVAGAAQPSGGTIFMRGEAVRFASVHDARSKGVTTVFQEMSLVATMTVEENPFLGAEMTRGGFLDKGAIRRGAKAILEKLNFPLSPTARVGTLSRAEQQMVEIARAFRSDLSVLILDEPTASLTDHEAERLFELVVQAQARGVGVIYITHRLREIERIADRITVLRDGKHIATVNAKGMEGDELVRLMTGRVVGTIFPDVRTVPGRTMLTVDRLTTASGSIAEASLDVRVGEIVGLAGLVGSGKSEVMRAVFGLEPIAGGTVVLDGRDITGRTPRQQLDAGLLYLPPDRRVEGLAMMRSCRENMTFTALAQRPLSRGPFLDRWAETRLARRYAARMELHPPRPDRAVEGFSGGNQQKVLLARSLTRATKLYVFDEPTVGVDVGTRASIYRFIVQLCEDGAAVVLISSDLPEILHLAHRAYVFYAGRIQAEIAKADLSEARVLAHFFDNDNDNDNDDHDDDGRALLRTAS